MAKIKHPHKGYLDDIDKQQVIQKPEIKITEKVIKELPKVEIPKKVVKKEVVKEKKTNEPKVKEKKRPAKTAGVQEKKARGFIRKKLK